MALGGGIPSAAPGVRSGSFAPALRSPASCCRDRLRGGRICGARGSSTFPAIFSAFLLSATTRAVSISAFSLRGGHFPQQVPKGLLLSRVQAVISSNCFRVYKGLGLHALRVEVFLTRMCRFRRVLSVPCTIGAELPSGEADVAALACGRSCFALPGLLGLRLDADRPLCDSGARGPPASLGSGPRLWWGRPGLGAFCRGRHFGVFHGTSLPARYLGCDLAVSGALCSGLAFC